jgi:hypothetical protein
MSVDTNPAFSGSFDARRCVVIRSPMGGTDPNLDIYLRGGLPFIAFDIEFAIAF